MMTRHFRETKTVSDLQIPSLQLVKNATPQKPWDDKHWKQIWSAQTQQDSLEVAASAPFAARTATVELHKLL